MDVVVCRLELSRSSDSSVRLEAVSMPLSTTELTPADDSLESRLSTMADLKDKIQTSFNIPKPIQKLSYEDQVLDDSVPLEEIYMREGDIIRVCYSHEGDCKEIIETVQWLKKVEAGLSNQTKGNELQLSIKDCIVCGIRDHVLPKLREQYFYPWFNSCTYINKLHFIALGGFDTMMNILGVVMENPKKEFYCYLQVIAIDILRCSWNMCESIELKKVMLEHNRSLSLCLRCFTLVKVETVISKHGSLEISSIPRTAIPLIRMVYGALGLLCNLSELPESHIKISTYPGCINQLSEICCAPRVEPIQVELATATLFQLSYSQVSHPLMLYSRVLHRVLDATENAIGTDYILPRFFVQLLFSQVVLGSFQIIPRELADRIRAYMVAFLSNTSCAELKQMLIDRQYEWCVFSPVVKLLYVKSLDEIVNCPNSMNSTRKEINSLSMRSVILALRVMIGREENKQMLIKENLKDFICCAPFYLPEELRAEAKVFAKEVGCLQPPSLLNIVRSKLAKIHYGLMPILERSISEIVAGLSSQ